MLAFLLGWLRWTWDGKQWIQCAPNEASRSTRPSQDKAVGKTASEPFAAVNVNFLNVLRCLLSDELFALNLSS